MYTYPDLPTNECCLLFDSVPEGYRRAWEWVTQKWDAGKFPVLSRLVVPCAPNAEEWADYTLLNQPRPVPKGRVEFWPEGTVFEHRVIEIDVPLQKHVHQLHDREWPVPSSNKISDWYLAGHCSERALHYPHPFTGLTAIQTYMLELPAKLGRVTMQECIQLASAHFEVDITLVLYQFERLCLGHDPWIVSMPTRGAVVNIRPAASVSGPWQHPCLPPLVVNGPAPFGTDRILSMMYSWIARGIDQVNDIDVWEPVYPSSPSTLPYGVPWSQYHAEWKDGEGKPMVERYVNSMRVVGRSAGAARGADPAPEPAPALPLRCAVGHTLKVYPTLSEYIREWRELKLADIKERREPPDVASRRMHAEQRFMRDLWTQRWVEGFDRNGEPVKKRFFLDDESTAQKRQRLLLDGYDPDLVDGLMELPVKYIAKDRWREVGEPTFFALDVLAAELGEAYSRSQIK